MKRNLFPITLLLAGVMMLASCLNDEDDSIKITYYGDAALTSFSVGTLTRTYLNNKGEALKSTVDGTDSTTTVDGSKYKFTIDQLKREIYNADSLPAGTAVSKVVCSLASKNSGVVYVKRMASDTLDYFTGNDSIDFKDKRVFRVYSTDGQSYRDYNVEIRVHKELADSFEWQREDVSNILPDLGKYKGVKIFAMGENVFAMVNDGATSFVMRKGINDNSRWNTVTPNVNTVFSPDTYKNVATLDGWIYMLTNGIMFKSKDGAEWQNVNVQGVENLKQLVGASATKLYAITQNGMASSKDGEVWTDVALDGDKNLLPTGSISFCTMPSTTNKGVDRLVMVGNSAKADTAAVVWGKIEDYSEEQDSYSWSLYEGNYKKELPNMAGLSVVRYDGRLYAIGGAGLGGSTAQPYAQLYFSKDQGLTWHKSTLFTLPADMPKDVDPNTLSMTTDKYNNVWIISASTAQVWKMRINRLGWKTEQTAFSE